VFAECARVLRAGGRLAVGAWGPFGDSAAEDALRRALDAAVPADGDRAGGNPADRDPARGDPADGDRAGGGTGAAGLAALLRAGGLVVVHETGDDVRLRFATSAGYAAWRTSFPDAATGPADGTRDPATSAAGPGAARAALVRRVADLLGAGPVVVPVHVHYATATTPRT
jgi:hypothetical protein